MRTLSREEQRDKQRDKQRERQHDKQRDRQCGAAEPEPAPWTEHSRARGEAGDEGGEDRDSDEDDWHANHPVLQLRRQRLGHLTLLGSALPNEFWTELCTELALRVQSVNTTLTKWVLRDGDSALAAQVHRFAETRGIEVVRMDKWREPPGGVAATGSADAAATAEAQAAVATAEAQAVAAIAEAQAAAAAAEVEAETTAATAEAEAGPALSARARRWAPLVAVLVLGAACLFAPWDLVLTVHPSFARPYPC
jgi:hypothetical protein